MRESLPDIIADIFVHKLNRPVDDPDTDLFETAVLDSLAFVDLLMYLEEAFQIRIEADDFELDHFRSIARIAAFVETRRVRTGGVAAAAGANV